MSEHSSFRQPQSMLSRPLQEEGAFDSAEHHHPVGPGHRTDGEVRYVLVTPQMLEAMNGDRAASDKITPSVLNLPPSMNGGQSHHASPTQSPESHPEKGQSLSHNERVDAVDPNGDIPYRIAPHEANPITKGRYFLRQYLGEFIGTMILIIFGNGVNCQVVLNNNTQGSYLSISFGWGIGVMFGVYICGGISGAHINPAVTLALAIFRGFPWKKVPGYVLAQILGACVGSCLIQGNYHNLLNQFEGGYNVRTYGLETSTATLFFTDTKPYMSNIGAFFSEVLATAVLLAIIMCIGDTNNNPAPPGMNGIFLLWAIVGIGATLGTQTAYCLNPARDIGPRIACSMFGYPGKIWSYRNCYWIYTPIIGTCFGALLGCFFYDLFIYTGTESPLNRVWGRPGRKNKTIVDSDESAAV